jgi:hypothetical protein
MENNRPPYTTAETNATGKRQITARLKWSCHPGLAIRTLDDRVLTRRCVDDGATRGKTDRAEGLPGCIFAVDCVHSGRPGAVLFLTCRRRLVTRSRNCLAPLKLRAHRAVALVGAHLPLGTCVAPDAPTMAGSDSATSCGPLRTQSAHRIGSKLHDCTTVRRQGPLATHQ